MILEKVKEILAKMLGYDDPKEISPEFTFEEDLNMDSSDLSELFEIIDSELGTNLYSSEDNFQTVQQLVTYIKKARLNK